MPLPASAPVPPVAHRHRRRGRAGWLLAALLSAALAVALGVSATNRYTALSSPESVVRAYFDALAGGDAPAALALADAPPRSPYLTSVVLGQQLRTAPLADLTLAGTATLGATATVEVRYRLLFGSGTRLVSDTAKLVRRGSSWRMSRVASTVRLSAGSPLGGRVRLAGRTIPASGVALFPGALPVAADPPGLQVLARTSAGARDDQPVVRLADAQLSVRARVTLSPELREQAGRATQALLAGCLAPASKDPLCPLPDAARPVPGSLHGSAPALATAGPRIELEEAASGVISVRAQLPVRGSWQVWDYENQVVRRSGPVTVAIDARVFVDRPTQAFWKPPTQAFWNSPR